jgi:hypothetical protein
MSTFLAATEPARTIVIERGGAIVNESGGTPTWVTFLLAFGVALVAAAVSYSVTWKFKKTDVDRENALRAVDLVDEAEQIAALRYRYRDEGGSGHDAASPPASTSSSTAAGRQRLRQRVYRRA